MSALHFYSPGDTTIVSITKTFCSAIRQMAPLYVGVPLLPHYLLRLASCTRTVLRE